MKFCVTLKNLLTIAIVLVFVIAASGLCAGQYSFRPLGFVSEFVSDTRATAISDDGSTVVGAINFGGEEYSFRWTSAAGMRLLSGLEQNTSTAWDVSADGTVVVGRKAPGRFPRGSPYRWTESTGAVLLADFPDSRPTWQARGVSADGTVIVGEGDLEAFRWTPAQGPVRIGNLLSGDGFYSDAYAVSADGSVIVGADASKSGQEAFRWTGAGGIVGIGDLPGGEYLSFARDVSADGSVVVGRGTSAFGPEAFRWTLADGIVGLGDLPGGTFGSMATGISADGSVVVGMANLGGAGNDAFIWTPSTGMLNLEELLVEHGASGLTGWTRLGSYVLRVSADGRTISGTAFNPSGVKEPFMATIPAVPEPSTYVLALVAAAACLLILRTRRRLNARTTAPIESRDSPVRNADHR